MTAPVIVDVHPLVDSSELLLDRQALRRRAIDDGYVFLPGLIDQERVREAREAMLRSAARHGMVAHSTTETAPHLLESVPLVEGQSDEWFELTADLLRLEPLYALAWDIGLRDAVEAIIGPDAIPHPCSLFRVVGPGVERYAKPAHQDGRYIGLHASIWTAWIAVADCDERCGGLQVLEKSHGWGELPVRAAEWGKEAIAPAELEWRWSPMKAGDALLFSNLTVHRGVPNVSADRVRLSADFRYQPRSQPFRVEALLPHLRVLGWDEAYCGWTGDTPQYYWREFDVRFEAGQSGAS